MAKEKKRGSILSVVISKALHERLKKQSIIRGETIKKITMEALDDYLKKLEEEANYENQLRDIPADALEKELEKRKKKEEEVKK